LGEEGEFDGGNTATHSNQYPGPSFISGVSRMTHYMSIYALLLKIVLFTFLLILSLLLFDGVLFVLLADVSFPC